MEFTTLGRTGLTVSRLCLGTMNFGPKTSEEDSYVIMDRALEHGINYFDTADVYGWQLGGGVTESIIGRWFAQGEGRRDKVVLATKVYGRMGDWPNENGLSARHIIKGCEESLRRLQTDWIDVYQMHHVDRKTPWEEIWQAMEILVTSGKVRYVGSSNFAEGTAGRAGEAGGRAMNEMAEHRTTIEAYEKLCETIEADPADVAIAWLLSRPGVTAPIIGPRTLSQLDGTLRAFDVTLDDGVLDQLDQLFPPVGKGGPGPEAWAW
jgi:aryl-alcohol dehydrogenase-like predicted oxidoreductase